MLKNIIDKIQIRWNANGGYRQVLVLAIPLILSTGSTSVHAFISRIFLTWHSPVSLAASMPAGMFNFAIMSIFINTAGYAGTFVAQYYGAGQHHKIGPILWQAGIVALIGAAINIALVPLAPGIFNWVGHDPAVRDSEIIYFQVLCVSAFPSIMASAFSGMLSGLGKTRIIMWIMLSSTLVNILGDYVLIFGNWNFPALGIAGAGWASVIAFCFQITAFSFIIFSSPFRKKYKTSKIKPNFVLFSRLIRFGLPSGVQFFIDMAGFTAFILLVGRLGRDQLAATNLAININMLAFMPMIGIGITISVLVAQALGRNKPDLAKYSVRSAFDLTFLYMVIIAFLFIAVPGVFLAPFQTKSDPASFINIKNIAHILLRFIAVYTLFDALNIIFSSAIKGAGDTRFVMYMILALSISIFIIPLYTAITWFNASIYVCWAIASVYVALLGIAFYLRYRHGKWQNMRVIEGSQPFVV
jgi:multidrug resistance protein, MATE family